MLLTLTVLIALLPLPANASEQPGHTVPVLRAPAGQAIPDQYVVTIAQGTDPASVAQSHRASVTQVWRDALNGFVAALTASDVETLRRDPLVESIPMLLS
jgi:hypothetical protein